MIKLGTKVKIARKNLKYESELIEDKYLGKIGIVTKEGNGQSVGNMVYVTVDNVGCDAFWPEELKEVK